MVSCIFPFPQDVGKNDVRSGDALVWHGCSHRQQSLRLSYANFFTLTSRPYQAFPIGQTHSLAQSGSVFYRMVINLRCYTEAQIQRPIPVIRRLWPTFRDLDIAVRLHTDKGPRSKRIPKALGSPSTLLSIEQRI